MKYTLLAGLLVALPTLFTGLVSAQKDRNMPPDNLIYINIDNVLTLYDPRTRVETSLLPNVDWPLAISSDLKVAYRTPDENDLNLYVYNTASPDISPQVISENAHPHIWSPDGRYLAHSSVLVQDDPDGLYMLSVWDDQTATNIPLGQMNFHYSHLFNMQWSPGGRYLAFIGVDEHSNDAEALFVWDGNNVHNVMPEYLFDEVRSISLNWRSSWSPDGKLAFTVHYGSSQDNLPSEIYLWTGEATINFGQNPEIYDYNEGWNSDGQLLFSSIYNDEFNYYVWNGEYGSDTLPKSASFIPVAPGLSIGSAGWVDESLVGIVTNPNAESGLKEVVLWDVETASIITRSTIASELSWNHVAEGGEYVFSWQIASGLPSDYIDIETMDGEIVFSEHIAFTTGYHSAWSAEGMFAYCNGVDTKGHWSVSIWDGEETWQFARISGNYFQWTNGIDRVYCSYG